MVTDDALHDVVQRTRLAAEAALENCRGSVTRITSGQELGFSNAQRRRVAAILECMDALLGDGCGVDLRADGHA